MSDYEYQDNHRDNHRDEYQDDHQDEYVMSFNEFVVRHYLDHIDARLFLWHIVDEHNYQIPDYDIYLNSHILPDLEERLDPSIDCIEKEGGRYFFSHQGFMQLLDTYDADEGHYDKLIDILAFYNKLAHLYKKYNIYRDNL